VVGDRFEIAKGRFANALLGKGHAECGCVGRGGRRNRLSAVEATQELRCEPVDAEIAWSIAPTDGVEIA
jgi:hypothetical protein